MLDRKQLFAGLIVAGIAFGGTACSKKSETTAEQSGDVVAKVDDQKIYVADLKEELDKLPPYLKGRVATPEGRKEFLDNLLTRRALMKEAADTGIEDDPKIQKQIREYKERLLLQKLMEHNIDKEPKIADTEIREYYDSHPDEFQESEQVRVRHILIKTEAGASAEQKAEAKKQAAELLKKAKSGADFEALAREHSQDPGSASRGGDLNFFPRGRMAKNFEEVAFSMSKKGELSDVVETQFGYHVIQYVESKTTKGKTFEEAKEQIRRRLAPQKQRESYQSFIENVKKKHTIVINEDVLASIGDGNAPKKQPTNQATMPAPEKK